MNTSGFFQINVQDLAKGLVMAVLSGVLLPLAAIVQTPDFSIATINWHQVVILAVNGAIVGFVGYLVKAFSSDESGKVFGKIG